jgi:hypothetical protein
MPTFLQYQGPIRESAFFVLWALRVSVPEAA